MNKDGIAELERSLRLAERASLTINTCSSAEDALDAWAEFLNAADRFYEKLKAGSKGTKSFDWHTAKMRLRDEDPMLRYVNRARNTDHHGLKVTATHTATDVGIWPSKGGQPIARPLLRLELLPVQDHGGILLQPPKTHLGQTFVPAFIAHQVPTNVRHVTGATAQYFKSVIEEARKLT